MKKVKGGLENSEDQYNSIRIENGDSKVSQARLDGFG